MLRRNRHPTCVRRGLILSLAIAALMLAATALAGTFQRSLTFRWPATANQTAFYVYHFSSPHVRSITFRSYGSTISPGLGGDQLVACFHRGPASLNWDWTQAANGMVTIRVRAVTGLCEDGPTVAGTTPRVALTIATAGGPPGPITTGSSAGSSSGRVTMPHRKHYYASPTDNIVCSISSASVFCQTFEPPQVVGMFPNGKLDMCSGANCTLAGMLGATVTHVPYGKSVTAGRFRCVSALTGFTCVNTHTRKGFVIARAGIKRVG